MLIRPYRPVDCEALASLFYDTVHTVNAADYSAAQLAVWADGHPDLAVWNRTFLAHDTLIAELDGQIVGFADMAADGYLDRLYVHSLYQRRGIASALVAVLEEHRQAAGIDVFYTFASITAKPFFERRGYALDRKNIVSRGGIRLMNYRMTKRLSD